MAKKCKRGYHLSEGKCISNANARVKRNNSINMDAMWIFVAIFGIVVIAGIILYGGHSGWFKSLSVIEDNDLVQYLNTPNGEVDYSCSLSLNPTSIYVDDRTTGTIVDGKNSFCQVFASDGTQWIKVYEGYTDAEGLLVDTRMISTVGDFVFRAICDLNNNNRVDTDDCLTNPVELTVIPRPDENSCSEMDGGNNIYLPGITTYNEVGYMDYCLPVGQAVHEYWCEDGNLREENYACDYGETCVATRSGGYCEKSDSSGWSPGDTVWSGSDSGSIQFASGVNLVVLTPEDLGFESGGNCHLEVDLYTNWDYVGGESACSVQELNGVTYNEHLKWDFYDSAGLRYSRIDPYPRGVSETIYPVNYDGQNPWKLQITTLDLVQGCTLNYNWKMDIKVAECD